jgi:translation initiation factor 3 subunit C
LTRAPTEFDKLVRIAQRQQNVAEPIPPFFVRHLTTMESSITAALASEKEKAGGKKMNATNAKALTAMRQKVKKTIKEYEKEVKRFQEVTETNLCLLFLIKH